MSKNFYQKTAVLALHGFTGSGDDFEFARKIFFEKFPKNDLPAHAFDAPDLPVLDLAGTLAFLREHWEKLAELNIPRTLLGYSMGGRIALHLALTKDFWREGDRLVLVSASPGIENPQERLARNLADNALADEIERAESAEKFYAFWQKKPLIVTQSREPSPWRERLLERRFHADKGVWAQHLRELGTGALPSLWEKLSALNVPAGTQLVIGEEDEKFRAIAEKMHSKIPHSKIVAVPKSGHSPQLENAGEFVELVFGTDARSGTAN